MSTNKMSDSTKYTIAGVIGGIAAEILLLYYLYSLETETAIVYNANKLPNDIKHPITLTDYFGRGTLGATAEISPEGILHLKAPQSGQYVSSIFYALKDIPAPNTPNGDIGYTAIMKYKFSLGHSWSPVLAISAGLNTPLFYVTSNGTNNQLELYNDDLKLGTYVGDATKYFRVRLAVKKDADGQWRGRFWINDLLVFNNILPLTTWTNGTNSYIGSQLMFGLWQGLSEAWIDYVIFDGKGAFSPEEKSDAHYLNR